MSPYLFILAAEVLAEAFRKKKQKIKGIEINGTEFKLSQYADDTTAIVSDINSAHTIFNLLDFFRSLSGLSVNATKTEGMGIGSSRENKRKLSVIKWPIKPIKSLGAYYSYDQKLLREKNFIEKLRQY